MQTGTRVAFGLLLLVAAQACSVSPGDGSTCSQDPCSFCSGKADGVYADPGATGKTYFDCFDAYAPGGAECLACRGGESDAQCPSAAPASPAAQAAPASPVAAAVPASPAPVNLTAPVAGCTVQPGDGSNCSVNPCSFCLGIADGLYMDQNNTLLGLRTFFDCFAATQPAGAECLACSNGENDTHCPMNVTLPASPPPAAHTPASPAPPVSPAPPSTCSVTPGDGSTCSQNPCDFCAGKADGTYADVGAAAGKTFYDCFSAHSGGGAECLKCWSNTWSSCPAPGTPATPGTVPASPATPYVPATPVVTAATVESAVDSALSTLGALGRKRLS